MSDWMKTVVEIQWDEPKDQHWLCPANIAIALRAYCQNTQFKVEYAETEIARLREENARMKAVVAAARRASEEIQSQKVNWPGEVDTLMDALKALDERGEG